MRRLDKQITDLDIINEILNNSEICRLGLVDNGDAYIVPVNYAHENGIIYIHSAHEGRKMNILKQDGHVTFEIEHIHEIIKGTKACNWTTRYRSVMGKGFITIDNDIESKKKGLDLIMRKYSDDITMEPVYDERVLERMTLLIMKIESVSGKQSGNWNEDY
jgi:prepilin-type processing-associated H-X9-DG protein